MQRGETGRGEQGSGRVAQAHVCAPVRRLVVFTLEGVSFALSLDQVLKSVRAVALTPLPQAPEIISGIVNWQGRIIPVVNLRKRLMGVDRELMPTDQLLIVQSATRVLAMIVDSVGGVVECTTENFTAIDSVVTGARHVNGVVKGADGMMLIQDLDRLLSPDEESGLDATLSQGR